MSEQQLQTRLGGALIVSGALGLLAATACYAMSDFTHPGLPEGMTLGQAIAEMLRAGPVADAPSIIELIADVLLLVGALMLAQVDWPCRRQRIMWAGLAIAIAMMLFADGFSGYVFGQLSALPLSDRASLAMAQAWLYMSLAIGATAVGVSFCVGYVASSHWPAWMRVIGTGLAVYFLTIPAFAQGALGYVPGLGTVIGILSAVLLGTTGWKIARSA